MRTQQEMIRAAIVTERAQKRAEKLREVFSHKAYTAFIRRRDEISVDLEKCRLLKIMALAICDLLSKNPDAEMPGIEEILSEMRKAKRSLKERIFKNKTYLKIKLNPS